MWQFDLRFKIRCCVVGCGSYYRRQVVLNRCFGAKQGTLKIFKWARDKRMPKQQINYYESQGIEVLQQEHNVEWDILGE